MCAALLLLQRAQRARNLAFPSDLETSLASQNLRVAAAPMSDADLAPVPGYRRGVPSSSASTVGVRADSAVPSEYTESVAAARKQYGGGAWGRS